MAARSAATRNGMSSVTISTTRPPSAFSTRPPARPRPDAQPTPDAPARRSAARPCCHRADRGGPGVALVKCVSAARSGSDAARDSGDRVVTCSSGGRRCSSRYTTDHLHPATRRHPTRRNRLRWRGRQRPARRSARPSPATESSASSPTAPSRDPTVSTSFAAFGKGSRGCSGSDADDRARAHDRGPLGRGILALPVPTPSRA